jgi:hypothetical protein
MANAITNDSRWAGGPPRLVRFLAATLAFVVLGALVAVPAADARPADPRTAEAEFLNLLNFERAKAGLPSLYSHSGLQRQARDWSGVMASQGRIFHTSTLSADTAAVMPDWQRAGENVGYGQQVRTLHDAFVRSAPHYRNITGDFSHVGVGVVYHGDRIYVTFRFAKSASAIQPLMGSGTPQGNLWLADQRGYVHAFGTAQHYGDAGTLPLNRPVVGMTPTSTKAGYWLLGEDGGVFTYGDARFYGSTGAMRLNRPVNGIAATPDGGGYWLVASDGGIFSFGNARFYGSTGGMRLNQPINGMAPTPTGRGYWLVASDGGIFSFGDARFYGSAGSTNLGAPTVGITTSPTGRGYLIATANGRVEAYGDAVHRGDARSLRLPAPISRIQVTPDGGGYWLVGRDGQVYPYGNAGSRISGPLPISGDVVAVAAR